MEIDPRSWMPVRPRKYQGPCLCYPYEQAPWLRDLGRAYAERWLINGTICPHRGTDLSAITPDESGVITWPLHGLRWHTSTDNFVMSEHIQ